jgi:hypothetical protein
VEPLLNPRRAEVRWWVGRFDLLERLERPSMDLDRTIRRVAMRTLRQHRDLRRHIQRLNVPEWDVLAYQAIAEGAYGQVRLAALLPFSPFEGADPEVFALDGERRSLHRNPPFDDGVEGVSAHLCLYFRGDRIERRWTAEYGLLELFDLGRRHLAAEDIWRKENYWPTEDAPHGNRARPAPPRPDLKIERLRAPEIS